VTAPDFSAATRNHDRSANQVWADGITHIAMARLSDLVAVTFSRYVVARHLSDTIDT